MYLVGIKNPRALILADLQAVQCRLQDAGVPVEFIARFKVSILDPADDSPGAFGYTHAILGKEVHEEWPLDLMRSWAGERLKFEPSGKMLKVASPDPVSLHVTPEISPEVASNLRLHAAMRFFLETCGRHAEIAKTYLEMLHEKLFSTPEREQWGALKSRRATGKKGIEESASVRKETKTNTANSIKKIWEELGSATSPKPEHERACIIATRLSLSVSTVRKYINKLGLRSKKKNAH